MRDALSLTDQAIAFGNGELLEAACGRCWAASIAGTCIVSSRRWHRATARRWSTEGLRRDGLSAASTLEEMTTLCCGMAVLQAVPSCAEGLQRGSRRSRNGAARRNDARGRNTVVSASAHGRGELGLAPDEYAALTMVLLRLLAFKPTGAAGEENSE
jgi:DNA polymerase-3 subunit gamma/tau